MYRFLLIIWLTTITPFFAMGISALEIIRRVDRQQRARTSSFVATMTVRDGSRVLKKKFQGYGMDKGNKFFFSFTNPSDRGVKYLRIENSLWIYLPDADDIMRLSGHMLRRGMMGSDISYEDLMQFEHFEQKYSLKLLGSKTVDGRDCFVVHCTAKDDSPTYHQQRLLIDKTWFIPLRLELYTRSGRKLKIMEHTDVCRIGGRNVPFRMTVRDTRRSKSLTEVVYSKIRYNVHVPAGTFTRRNLRR